MLADLQAFMGIPIWAMLTAGLIGVVFGIFFLIRNLR